MSRPTTLTALLHGPDQTGLVARVSGWIFQRGGNILHADQHRDDDQGIFFQRVEWIPSGGDLESEERAFQAFGKTLGMQVSLSRSDRRRRMALLVSKYPHCFHDLLARWRAGELRADVSLVLSNHESLAADAAFYGLPFHVVPVSRESRAEAEERQLELLHAAGIELVVMARYMQVLSAGFLDRVGCPVINIHHSFLPAFAGAKPYHQAHQRGVKVIGATAHYATAVLDDGPIIHQAVAPVSHRHNVNDLMRIGRDLEKTVLAQAVRWHLESRVLAYANKTVVFD